LPLGSNLVRLILFDIEDVGDGVGDWAGEEVDAIWSCERLPLDDWDSLRFEKLFDDFIF